MDTTDIRNNITIAHETGSMITPNSQLFSMDGRSTLLNNNVMVVGTSGSGKTRSTVIPNIISAVGSYIVTDPKGNLYSKYGNYMRSKGYRTEKLDLIHPELSVRYNPLCYLKNTNDIVKLAHQIVYGSDARSGGRYDPFWDRASVLLLSLIIGYFLDGGDEWEFSLQGIIKMLSSIDTEAMECGAKCEFDNMFERLNRSYMSEYGESCWSYNQYKKFKHLSSRTNTSIIMTLHGILGELDTKEIHDLMTDDEIDITSIAKQKTIVFVEISDTDRSKDVLANIFYTQAMNQLCSYADEQCADSRLPIPVRFILDDFATNCRIDGFENMISNIRSRNISATLILQSVSQLEAGYGASAHTIMDNCDTQIYLGGNDLDTALIFAKKCNKPVHQILNMPLGTNWMFRRGQKPLFSRTVDLSEYSIDLTAKNIKSRKTADTPIDLIPPIPDTGKENSHD